MARTPVHTTEALRAVEQQYERAHPSLMARAGEAIARHARQVALDRRGPILVAAGPGNNGGDARLAAETLAKWGREVIVVDAKGAWPQVQAALVIDGLLGIGLSRDVDGAMAACIDAINKARAPILAIDVPSGLDSDSGLVRGRAVRATHTLTFLAHKPGLHTNDGPDHAGEISLDALGTGEAAAAGARGTLLALHDVAHKLEPRRRNTHKGHFGTVGIVGGAPGMVGAALLAGRAALWSGAGKVRVGLLDNRVAVDFQQPELMLGRWQDALDGDVVVLGPGAGSTPSDDAPSDWERDLVPRAIASDKVLVFDADALNLVARSAAIQESLANPRQAATLMTPHPAEAARLLAVDTRAVQADRVAAALAIAARFHSHVVLKGTGSVCAFPDGSWSINTTGNPGLASGGTGDVLAGMLGALLCQDMDARDALELAVCLHGAAADSLVARGIGPVGMTATEVAHEARALLNGAR